MNKRTSKRYSEPLCLFIKVIKNKQLLKGVSAGVVPLGFQRNEPYGL
jgi:hypothetical protein